MNIGIVVVTYNRIESLKRLLASLENAFYPESVTLCLSVDRSDSFEVECFADSYSWPHGNKRIIKHRKNLGTRRHVLSLGTLFEDFDALIVLEDDLIVSPSYYLFAKACVSKYEAEDKIAGISLYSFGVNYQNQLPFEPLKSPYDVFFMNCAQSWGQVWLKRQWLEFKAWYDAHSGHFDVPTLPDCLNKWPDRSWLKYHTRYCIEHDLYFVYPYTAFSTNNAEVGVNVHQADTLYQVRLQLGRVDDIRLPTLGDARVRYDGFFEPKYIASFLGVKDEELCVDFYGEKAPSLYTRFLLSTKALPYKVMKSFALELRPFEMNVIEQRVGSGIWLYDTGQKNTPPKAGDRYQRYSYFYGKGFYKARTMIGAKRVFTLLAELALSRFRR